MSANILTDAAAAEAVEHIEWMRGVCELAGVPHRAVELIERGLTRRDAIDELYPLVHGVQRPSATAPFRTLFSGCWSLNDPELDEVML